jgi:hypothetical protein
MENNFGTPAPGAGDDFARQQVNTPAILLMVVGGLTVAYSLFGVVQSLIGTNTAQLEQVLNNPDLPAGARSMLSGIAKGGVFFNLLPLILGGVTVFGGLKMKNLENYGLAVAASIITLIPCFGSCCCLFGIPVGIWSLIVLNKPEVKSAFRPS